MDIDLAAAAKLGASIGGVWASWKWVIPWLKNDVWPVLKGFKAIADLPQVVATCGTLEKTLQGQNLQLTRVVKEVLPNGGSSLRDAVSRVENASVEHGAYLRVLAGTMRANLDSDPVRALFETDAHGANLWVNKTYLRWVNRSAAEMQGWGWLAAIADRDRVRVRTEWESAVEERRQFNCRYFLRDSAGVEVEVECSATPIPEGGDAVERYVGVIRRIDRRVYEDQE
jgi:PAS domain S-box-containing protein